MNAGVTDPGITDAGQGADAPRQRAQEILYRQRSRFTLDEEVQRLLDEAEQD